MYKSMTGKVVDARDLVHRGDPGAPLVNAERERRGPHGRFAVSGEHLDSETHPLQSGNDPRGIGTNPLPNRENMPDTPPNSRSPRVWSRRR